MASCKIYLDKSKLPPDSTPSFLTDLLNKELDVEEDTAIVIIPATLAVPAGCYIEILCKKQPNRTHQVLQSLAIQIDESARRLFQIEEPIRVRIIMLEEDFFFGVN